jgi:hypothetical protein
MVSSVVMPLFSAGTVQTYVYFCSQFSSLVTSAFRGNAPAMAAGGLMDSSVGMMPLFSTGTVLGNMGSGAAGERFPGLVDPMMPAPTVRGGLSRAEGPIYSSDRGLLYRYISLLL